MCYNEEFIRIVLIFIKNLILSGKFICKCIIEMYIFYLNILVM